MEERLKILKMMNEATGRMDLSEFARTIGSTPKQVVEQMEELAKADFVRKSKGGYGITEKGKNTLKAYAGVPENMEFQFYMGIGQPTGLIAKTLKEFYEKSKVVNVVSLDFHLYRKDFENWIRNAFKDVPLAEEFSKMREARLNGENLRGTLLKTMEVKYNFGDFE